MSDTPQIISFTDTAKSRSDDLIWKCDCGNCAFILHESTAIECSSCGTYQDGTDMEYTLRQWTRKVEDNE